jgi:hypothetical protein
MGMDVVVKQGGTLGNNVIFIPKGTTNFPRKLGQEYQWRSHKLIQPILQGS